MQKTSKLFRSAISIASIFSMLAISLVAVPVYAVQEITGATVVPGTIDISTTTNVVVSFTTPVGIPADGEIVVVFPGQFGLQAITSVSSVEDIDGELSFELVDFTTLHISRSGGAGYINAGFVIDDLTINNVTTPPIADYVGDYTVYVQDALDVVLASGRAQGQTFEDLVTAPDAPLSLTLVSPNGGEVMSGNDDFTISWVINGETPFAKLFFSNDGGLNYSLIAEGLSGGTYSWTVPNADVEFAKIKVVSVDEYGSEILVDISDANFQIVHTDDVVVIEEPEVLISPNTLVKGVSLPAVYFFGEDSRRYVFPNESIFYSWYSNFDDVVTVDDSVIASFRLGSRITMAPGSLIKINSNPKVYAVDSNGNKRHVKDEETATRLFGADWNTQIVDIDVTQWSDYPEGEQLNESSTFSVVVPSFPITRN